MCQCHTHVSLWVNGDEWQQQGRRGCILKPGTCCQLWRKKNVIDKIPSNPSHKVLLRELKKTANFRVILDRITTIWVNETTPAWQGWITKTGVTREKSGFKFDKNNLIFSCNTYPVCSVCTQIDYFMGLSSKSIFNHCIGYFTYLLIYVLLSFSIFVSSLSSLTPAAWGRRLSWWSFVPVHRIKHTQKLYEQQ